ncbi:MAG: Gfo/Idh/MocA family oxidoreductase [Planctomycetota bacterium]
MNHDLRSLLLPPLLALLTSTPHPTVADDVRIGILGIDNYGSVAYTEFLNKPDGDDVFAGVRVVAACPIGSPDYPDSDKLVEQWKQQLLSLHQNPKDPKDAVPPIEMVGSVDELLQKCDGVMIFSLDGRLHLEQATAVLKAGRRLFIGRPMASSPADVIEIFRIAAETKTPCWSSSQHRYSSGFSGMRNHPEVGKVIGCDVYGGWTVDAPLPDQFTRPLHSIETLYAIMGPGVVSVTSTSTPTAESITAIWNDGRVGTCRGIKQGAVKYSATVFGDKGVSTAGIYGHGAPVNGVVPTNDRYVGYEGLAIELARFFKGGPVPVQPAETLEIYALLQAAEISRTQHGTLVHLPNLAQQLPPAPEKP